MARSLEDVARELVGGSVRTAGKIEFVKDQGPIRRDIRSDGFIWSPEALRNLAKILWAAQRGHSYAMTALRLFSRMPSADFSPDGLLGGRGYIQAIKEMRADLSKSVETLSSFTDTIYDEVNGDHWAMSEEPVAQELVESVDKVKADPEQYVEDEMDAEAPGASDDPEDEDVVQNPMPEEMNPDVEEPAEQPTSDEQWDENWSDDGGFAQMSATMLPQDQSEQGMGLSLHEMTMRTTLPDSGDNAPRRAPKDDDFTAAIEKVLATPRRASSSLPVDTMSGPRVEHIGPGMTENGYEGDEELPSDGFSWESFTSLDPVYKDSAADGVSGYEDPTDGDETVLHFSSALSRIAEAYSLLPGGDNSKPMNLYGLDVSDEEIAWMESHSDPDVAGEEDAMDDGLVPWGEENDKP